MQKLLTFFSFFQQKILASFRFNVLNSSETLSNDIICFKQLGPVLCNSENDVPQKKEPIQYSLWLYMTLFPRCKCLIGFIGLEREKKLLSSHRLVLPFDIISLMHACLSCILHLHVFCIFFFQISLLHA